MDLTPKQQVSEAIRQAESILLMTGQRPSVDQVTAVLSLATILRRVGKQVSAVISDGLPAATAMLDTANLDKNLGGTRDFVMKVDVLKTEVDKLRYEVADGKLNVIITPYQGGFAPGDVTFGYGEAHVAFDLVVALGVPSRARLDRLYDQNAGVLGDIPLVNLDFHRSNENYGAVNQIDSTASSLCEMMVALSESLQGGLIDAEVATPLLMGIVASTDRFSAAHTTPKSLTVAAQMMAAGAKQPAIMRALYRDGGRGASDGRTEGRGGDQRERGGERTTERGNERVGERGGERSGERGGDRSSERQSQSGGRREPAADIRRQPTVGEPRREAPVVRSDPEAVAPTPTSSDVELPSVLAVQASTPAPEVQPAIQTVPTPARPTGAPVMNLDAVVRAETGAPELPIMTPDRAVSQPPLAQAGSPAPSAAQLPTQSSYDLMTLVDDPGQLPAEMSPLGDVPRPAPVLPGQQLLAMSMSDIRDDQA
jgi:hypothetical protein